MTPTPIIDSLARPLSGESFETGPAIPSVYVPRRAEVTAVEKMTELERVLTLRLEDGSALDHRPGQFVHVSMLGVGECPISICSSPTRGPTFSLCVRRVGQVTEHIHRLDAGDVVGIRGPYGNGFDLSELAGMDVLIVAGGLGLAPARSVIENILDERDRFGRFSVLYGAPSPHELLFREDLRQWHHQSNMDLHVTVDRPDEQWRGKTGVVTTLFEELGDLDGAKTVAIVIGPPVMFKFVLIELTARGVAPARITCSLERRMKCGIGKCGHCQINHVYVCREGPVFTCEELRTMPEALS